MRTPDAQSAALLQQALALHRQSRLAEAQAVCAQIVQLDPQDARAWHLQGLIALQSGQPDRALSFLNLSARHGPSNAAVHNEIGNAFLSLEHLDAAAAAYERAIAINPTSAQYHINRGNVLCRLQRFDAAILSFEATIALDPSFAGGYYNKGLALYSLQRLQASIADFDRAVALDPRHARAHCARGNALGGLELYREAVQSYDNAIVCRFDYAEAHAGRGDALLALEEYAAAVASFDAALALQPADANTHNNRGNALYQLGKSAEALASYESALTLRPEYAGVNFNCGQMLTELGRHAEAVASFERAMALNGELPYVRGDLLLASRKICDWREHERRLQDIVSRVEKGEPVATPFAMLALCDSALLQKQAAENWIHRNAMPTGLTPQTARRAGRERLHIGYFSADFRDHPIARLSAELFEMHDRSCFEISAFSIGPPAQGEMRERLERAFDRFSDVQNISAAKIAALSRRLEVDIAVDLTGLTTQCRPRIFAERAAPIQVSYLGYLGTSGAPWMDYVIADPTLVPPAMRANYTEHIAYLPSYQINDSKRVSADRTFHRTELGLPPTGFVFCCLNASYKITPAVFTIWMRILSRVPDAVLFLYAESTAAADNLRREARARHIDEKRLVFAARLAIRDHLARYRIADLFLDTLPYNAGTTASDALWSGLPVLTRLGETFAGRMGASLLASLGMSELITSTDAQYEEQAIALATQPGRLSFIKQRLAERIATAPLFDSRRHTMTMEAAYIRMWQRHERNLAPADLLIEEG
jgi:protein O-GlcNAc transferase